LKVKKVYGKTLSKLNMVGVLLYASSYIKG
jgi:hypothetical protein